MRFLALGDSYTIGEGVAEDQRWPNQWAASLRALGAEIETPRIIAQTGWTTDELSAAMDAQEPLGQWDLVSLLIGVNNQYRGRTVANYAAEFRVLLDRAVVLAGGDVKRVFVVSIPDWGVTAFAARDGRGRIRIGREIDAFNAAARTVCESVGVRFIDITPTSRDRGGDADMLANDGLHPASAMYTRWVDDIVHTLPVAGPG